MTLPNNGPQAGIPSWARVGAKVVCIAETFVVSPACTTRVLPVKGRVYTINDVGLDSYSPWIGLAELDQEVAYSAHLFRPLVTLEDDITTYFAELLNVPAGQKVEA